VSRERESDFSSVKSMRAIGINDTLCL